MDMPTPKFSWGQWVRSAQAIFPVKGMVSAIHINFCPCGCGHSWFTYDLQTGVTGTVEGQHERHLMETDNPIQDFTKKWLG